MSSTVAILYNNTLRRRTTDSIQVKLNKNKKLNETKIIPISSSFYFLLEGYSCIVKTIELYILTTNILICILIFIVIYIVIKNSSTQKMKSRLGMYSYEKFYLNLFQYLFEIINLLMTLYLFQ